MLRVNCTIVRKKAGFSLILVLIVISSVGQGCSGIVSGNSSSNTTSTTDTTPPSITITSPSANATLSGSVNLTANATDNVAVASVQFKADGTNTGSAVIAPPYAYPLDTKLLSKGAHVFTAVATDTARNSTTSGSVSVTVDTTTTDTTPPTVSITAPSKGVTVSKTVS